MKQASITRIETCLHGLNSSFPGFHYFLLFQTLLDPMVSLVRIKIQESNDILGSTPCEEKKIWFRSQNGSEQPLPPPVDSDHQGTQLIARVLRTFHYSCSKPPPSVDWDRSDTLSNRFHLHRRALQSRVSFVVALILQNCFHLLAKPLQPAEKSSF